ncbi:MAG: tyrosine-protein phosphatase [Lachnospiraceae bacterium]|nr:tyrosine-protein phosphatase [Lachnospiraceae bacterium]
MGVLEFDAKYEDIGFHGDIMTPFTMDDFAKAGFEFEDTIKVSFLDKSLIVPYVPSYRCTHSGGNVLVGNKMFKTIPLIAFHSNFVKKQRIAVFLENEDRDIDILVAKGIKFPIRFRLELAEKKGYHEEFMVYNLIRTNNREDYSDLSDEEYCNFRTVKGGRFKEGILYRSSSPIDPFMKRDKYADECLKKYGVKTIINLNNNLDDTKKFPNYNDTYYSKQKILFLNTNADVTSYNFGKCVLRAMHFINENEGPYLIHCMEGQDRTGAVCAIFESLLGASKNELIEDFMKTYENFYKVKKGSDQYYKIVKGEMQDDIASIRGFSYNTLDILKHPTSFLQFLDITNEDMNTFIAKMRGQ